MSYTCIIIISVVTLALSVELQIEEDVGDVQAVYIATVIEFRFFNRIKKKKKKNTDKLRKLLLLILHTYYIKLHQILYVFMVIITLMLVDVESESNFLKYGRIGKHPVQSLHTRYYRTL